MTIKAILACDINYGIGKDNKLPWPHNNDDMNWFKENTTDNVVVMGRKTWESLGSKKLSNRINCVMTHKPLDIKGVPDHILSGNINYILKTLEEKYQPMTVWIIGGGELYLQTVHLCSEIYLTRFRNAYICDTFIDPVIFNGFEEKIQEQRTTPECLFSVWNRT